MHALAGGSLHKCLRKLHVTSFPHVVIDLSLKDSSKCGSLRRALQLSGSSTHLLTVSLGCQQLIQN